MDALSRYPFIWCDNCNQVQPVVAIEMNAASRRSRVGPSVQALQVHRCNASYISSPAEADGSAVQSRERALMHSERAACAVTISP